jgi:hypothetical protein
MLAGHPGEGENVPQVAIAKEPVVEPGAPRSDGDQATHAQETGRAQRLADRSHGQGREVGDDRGDVFCGIHGNRAQDLAHIRVLARDCQEHDLTFHGVEAQEILEDAEVAFERIRWPGRRAQIPTHIVEELLESGRAAGAGVEPGFVINECLRNEPPEYLDVRQPVVIDRQ